MRDVNCEFEVRIMYYEKFVWTKMFGRMYHFKFFLEKYPTSMS